MAIAEKSHWVWGVYYGMYKAEVLHTDHLYISSLCEVRSLTPARPQHTFLTLQGLLRFLLAPDSEFQGLTLNPSHFSASKAGYVCSLLPRIYLTPGRSSSVLIRAFPSTAWLNRSPYLLTGFILKPRSSPGSLPFSPSMWIMFIHKHVLVSTLYLTEQASSPVSHKSSQFYNSTLGKLCLYSGSTHLPSTPIFPPFQWILNFSNLPLPTGSCLWTGDYSS